jgi:hypothetical protein
MQCKTIFTAKFARELIRKGFKVVDIKPNNTNKERSVFVFELTKELEDYINLHNTNNNYKYNLCANNNTTHLE